ncbi:GNAT family N-acetyltransferase [Pedobacter westerhofensis]|nr:GNAT family N-acetyltransferase [Pedobacter westerhofensis]
MNQDKVPLVFSNASTDSHFDQILSLQQQNHYSSVPAGQQQDNGFVFASHTQALLKKMAAVVPQVIALSGDRVVGYNLAMTSDMKNELPSLIPMFEEFEKWKYNGKPLMDYQFVIGGQVCVDKEFRGQGLISRLYQQTRDSVPGNYQLCVTEISVRNLTSLKAHQRMGFEIIGTYYDGIENWNLVVWDWHRAQEL